MEDKIIGYKFFRKGSSTTLSDYTMQDEKGFSYTVGCVIEADAYAVAKARRRDAELPTSENNSHLRALLFQRGIAFNRLPSEHQYFPLSHSEMYTDVVFEVETQGFWCHFRVDIKSVVYAENVVVLRRLNMKQMKAIYEEWNFGKHERDNSLEGRIFQASDTPVVGDGEKNERPSEDEIIFSGIAKAFEPEETQFKTSENSIKHEKMNKQTKEFNIVAIPAEKKIEAGDLIQRQGDLYSEISEQVWIKDGTFGICVFPEVSPNWKPYLLLATSEEQMLMQDYITDGKKVYKRSQFGAISDRFKKVCASYPRIGDYVPVISRNFVESWIKNDIYKVAATGTSVAWEELVPAEKTVTPQRYPVFKQIVTLEQLQDAVMLNKEIYSVVAREIGNDPRTEVKQFFLWYPKVGIGAKEIKQCSSYVKQMLDSGMLFETDPIKLELREATFKRHEERMNNEGAH